MLFPLSWKSTYHKTRPQIIILGSINLESFIKSTVRRWIIGIWRGYSRFGLHGWLLVVAIALLMTVAVVVVVALLGLTLRIKALIRVVVASCLTAHICMLGTINVGVEELER